jgi:hypothetical protein
MRRLVVEFVINELADRRMMPAMGEIESMEVISFLRSTPKEYAAICKIKLKNPKMRVEGAVADQLGEVQVLEQNREGSICYLTGRRRSKVMKTDPLGRDVYLAPPYEVHDGRLRVSFLANAGAVRRILRRLNKSGVSYKVVSLTDARFLPNSPLIQLTDKQRNVIEAAFKRGYYDVPRRVSSQELAKQLEIREPTLVMHRRKAERKLLSAVIEVQ